MGAVLARGDLRSDTRAWSMAFIGRVILPDGTYLNGNRVGTLHLRLCDVRDSQAEQVYRWAAQGTVVESSSARLRLLAKPRFNTKRKALDFAWGACTSGSRSRALN
ncbi:MAG UNVERIFIED_CONTAM: hypothetical protein LVT10_13810, partial [Anaerolineae bacterium]